MKRLVCFVLVFVLVFSNVNVGYAKDYTLVEAQEEKETKEFKWLDFGTSYYYVQLSEKYRDLYDKMYNILDSYLEGNITAVKLKDENKKTTYILEDCVKKEKQYKEDDYTNIFFMVCFENPQFFFIKPVLYDLDDETIGLSVNKQFNTQAKMKVEKAKVQKRLEDYIKVINKNVQLKTANDLSYYIAQKIYKSIPYDWTSVKFWTDEDKRMSQTIYSPLINKTTVCAGYSKLFAALMNYYGIETICVLGDGHAWNMSNLDGNWYVTDLTQATFSGDFYLFADAKQLKKYDKELLDDTKLHNPQKFYKTRIPEVSKTAYKNTYQFVEEKPVITVSEFEDNFYVDLKSNGNAKIYYSVDGGNVKEYKDSFALSRTKNHKVYAYAKGANTMQSAESVFIIRK